MVVEGSPSSDDDGSGDAGGGDLTLSGASRDPATGLAAVAALHRLAARLERLQVDDARRHGWTWAQIAEVMGVSKQAVHKKHAARHAGLQERSP